MAWIYLHDAALSIVAHREKPDVLLVRARHEGDIKKVFPAAKVRSTPKADYPFRAEIDRLDVATVMASRLAGIEYDNFKSAADSHRRHFAYMRIWKVTQDELDPRFREEVLDWPY